MKSLLVFTLLFSSSLMADDSRFPFPPVDDICHAPVCTDTMRAIVRDYKAMPDFFAIEEIPAFVSGSCYHIERGTNPNQEHHGMWLFEMKEGAPVFAGLFGFWYKSNPWADWTIEDARKRLEGANRHPVHVLEGEARGLIQSANANLFYWYKRDPATRTFILLAHGQYFASRETTSRFCRFGY